ncbi:hypothetical protein GCM10011573_35330 [Enterococcus wangshanyuanii]|uniref:Uncharacterized protein n=2 Tax=Enterococcus wangshanyuanii TaxID=2005703 RepID=A0ABQ1PT33_9ENTE|nr:hypothetical protein GCM10011573_35330 [Enterococcus wangshanyuanii]
MIIINVCIGILIALLVLQFIMLILTITEKKEVVDKVWSAAELNEKTIADRIEQSKYNSRKPYVRNWR